MSWGTRQGSAYDMVFAEGRYGNTPKPVTEMTLGEVVQFGKDVLIPGTKGKIGKVDKDGNPLGTSAVGAYQFTQGTLNDLAPKVLGENWQNTKFSPEVQEGLAKALYEQSKTGNLQARWEGVKNNKVGAYTNVPWEQARLDILKAESKLPEGSPVKYSQFAFADTGDKGSIEPVSLPTQSTQVSAFMGRQEEDQRDLLNKMMQSEAELAYLAATKPSQVSYGEDEGLFSVNVPTLNVASSLPMFDARRAKRGSKVGRQKAVV